MSTVFVAFGARVKSTENTFEEVVVVTAEGCTGVLPDPEVSEVLITCSLLTPAVGSIRVSRKSLLYHSV
jgi:hypothetical protein